MCVCVVIKVEDESVCGNGEFLSFVSKWILKSLAMFFISIKTSDDILEIYIYLFSLDHLWMFVDIIYISFKNRTARC